VNYTRLVVKLLSSAAGNALRSRSRAFSLSLSLSRAQFPVLNFQKRERLAEVTRFSRGTFFFGNCDFSRAGRRRGGGMIYHDDRPRRGKVSPLQPTHSSWQTDRPHLFPSLFGTPAKDTNPRRSMRQPSRAEANQNVVPPSSMHRADRTERERERMQRMRRAQAGDTRRL